MTKICPFLNRTNLFVFLNGGLKTRQICPVFKCHLKTELISPDFEWKKEDGGQKSNMNENKACVLH